MWVQHFNLKTEKSLFYMICVSWTMKAFTFSYKQRNEDFKKLFKDLPADERLLVDYACALQKEILAQGRLYISINYVCFYANIFGWETVVSSFVSSTFTLSLSLILNSHLIASNKTKRYQMHPKR